MIVNKGMYDKQFTDVELADGSVATLTLKPLLANDLRKLMAIAKVFSKADIDVKEDGSKVDIEDSKILDLLTEESMFDDVVDVVTKTITKSYPEWGKDVTEEFVSINLFVILPLVFEINFRAKK